MIRIRRLPKPKFRRRPHEIEYEPASGSGTGWRTSAAGLSGLTAGSGFPKLVCAKRPWGSARLLRKHRGRTGVIVHGWFPRMSVYGPPEWMSVLVRVEGGESEVVSQVGHRCDPVLVRRSGST